MHTQKLLLLLFSIAILPASLQAQQKKLRVLVIKAHPDEAEEYAGGTAALYSSAGHAVKFVSLTNGDVGHWKMTKEAIATRRKQEALNAGKILGVQYQILNYHDGELENSIVLRKEIVRIIREWKADIVITFLPMFGGGHPDNMTVAVAVQQAAGLTAAPLFLPDVPALPRPPYFLVMRDYYTKTFPHKPSLVFPIDEVMDKKLASYDAHASQFYEFAPYQRGILNEVPKDKEGKKAFLQKYWGEFSAIDDDMRQWLIQQFGPQKGAAFIYAEAFEFAPYSRKPSAEEMKILFPMLY